MKGETYRALSPVPVRWERAKQGGSGSARADERGKRGWKERRRGGKLTDHEINLVCPLLLEPVEREIHQGSRRVAVPINPKFQAGLRLHPREGEREEKSSRRSNSPFPSQIVLVLVLVSLLLLLLLIPSIVDLTLFPYVTGSRKGSSRRVERVRVGVREAERTREGEFVSSDRFVSLG